VKSFGLLGVVGGGIGLEGFWRGIVVKVGLGLILRMMRRRRMKMVEYRRDR
jgi:hypothetical protein